MHQLEDKQFIFVVGAPRSGTTWLHRMLAAHPAVASINHELTVFTYLEIWERRYGKEKFHLDAGHWEQGIPLLYSEEEFYAGLRTIADDVYARLLAKAPQATHILDKHPGYALRLPTIRKLYPNAKVIHIIRDGREVVVSMMSAKRRIGFGAGEIKGATRDWAEHVRVGQKHGQEWGAEHYLEIRYEQLYADTASGLEQVFAFGGLRVPKKEIEQIAANHKISRNQVSRGDQELNAMRDIPDAIWKNRLSLEERWILDRMAGDLLQELGYASPDWWALETMDRLKMSLYPIAKRLLNTLGSAKHTWNNPVVRRLKY